MQQVEKVGRFTIAIAATGTSFTQALPKNLNGVLTRYILEAPNTTSGPTITVSLVDENSVTVWTGADHAENANYSVPIDVEVCGQLTATLTLSGTAGAGGGTAYLTFFKRPW